MYWNPVFQRRLIRSTMEIGITKRNAFITGAVIVFILSILPFFSPEVRMIITVWLIAIAVFIIVIRLMGSALVSTAHGMRNIIAEDMKDPLLTTPVKNASIYYGVTLGSLMRGYKIIESMAGFIVGMLASYAGMVFVQIVLKTVGPIEIWIIPFMWLINITFIAVGIFVLGMLILLLITFASGYYATFLDLLTSIIMAVFHFALTVGSGGFFLYIPFILRDIHQMQPDEISNGFMFGGLFMIGWIALATIGTAWMGVISLAKKRCPGFYEPDEITAEDHVMRGM